MVRAGLILGSNMGDRLGHLESACASLEIHVGKLIGRSSVYISPPWGYDSQSEYYNQVLLFETDLEPLHLLDFCLRIEKRLGRVRNELEGYADRTIDIDVLFLGDAIIDSKNLTIPHPRMHLRKFCLLPLYEVNPDWVHPVLKRGLVYLIDHCEDNSELRRLD